MYLNDLAYFYYPLPLCLRIGSLQQFPPTLDFIDLAGAYRGGIAALAALLGYEKTDRVSGRFYLR